MTKLAVVYSDPNCPFCYATEERLHARGLDHLVEWRGVQHAPHLPVPMASADLVLSQELPAEVRAIRTRASEIPIAVPPGKPNTALAIGYGAAALRADADAGRRFVRSLYAAFWTAGRDISDPLVLDALAAESGLGDLRPDPAAVAVAERWQESWRRTGLGGVPLLVRGDGEVLYGLVDTDELAAFLAADAPGA